MIPYRSLQSPAAPRWRAVHRPGQPIPSTRTDFRSWTAGPPLLGLVSVLIGFSLAIYLLPADVEPADALRLPSLLFVLSLSVLPVLAAVRDPKSIVRAEHVLMLAPAYWLLLDPLQGRYPLVGVGREEVQRSFTAIALFSAGALFALIQRPWPIPLGSLRDSPNRAPHQVVLRGWCGGVRARIHEIRRSVEFRPCRDEERSGRRPVGRRVEPRFDGRD